MINKHCIARLYKGSEGIWNDVLHYIDTVYDANGDSNIIMRERAGETDIKSDIDTEDVEPDYLSINGSDAIYAYKEDMSSIGWLIDDTLITLSGPIEKDKIIKIAQNIKKFD